MSQCEVGAEEPEGCGIGPSAVAYYNSGLDLSQTFTNPGSVHRPRWVQFNVYRDATGRVGRILYRTDGLGEPVGLREERPLSEN